MTLNICDGAKQIYPKKQKKDSKKRYCTNFRCSPQEVFCEKGVLKNFATCLCVCLCSFTCWFLPAAGHLWYTWEVQINDLLLWAFSGCFCQVPSSLCESILFHLQRWKLQPTAYWRENERKCLESVEKMIYIDIGNKSAHVKPTSYEKILKIRRLL